MTSPPKRDASNVFDTFRWAVRLAWSKHASLVVGLSAVAVIQGLVPAGLAVAARGLVNTALELTSGQATTVAPVMPWVLLGLGLTLAEAFTRLLQRYISQRFRDDLELSVNVLTLEHAAGLDVSLFEDPKFQDVLHAARYDTAGHFSRFMTDAFAVVTQMLQVVSLVVVLVAIEPYIVLALIPVALAHLAYQFRLSKGHYHEQRRRSTKRRWSTYFVSLLTSRLSVPETRLLGLAPTLIDKFRGLMTEFREQNRRRHSKMLLGGTVGAVLTTVGVYATLVRVVQQAMVGALTIGDVAIFGTAGLRLRSALEAVAAGIAGVLEHVLYISNLRELLSIQPGAAREREIVPVNPRGEIEFRNVSFTYPGSVTPSLRDVSFHIEPGETVALVGENGAGKTTLVKLMARFYDPDAGQVLRDGIDVRELSLEDMYRRTAFVFQRARSFEATVFENIAYGDCDRLLDKPREIERIARRTGADEIVQRMPRGYETPLGRMFGEYDLSAGQWQQISIARAFARRDATLLILDEPTANLDVVAEYELLARFRALAKKRTTILIAHRFSTVRMADRIIVLDQGRVVEQGTHRELLARGGHYSKLYELQRKRPRRYAGKRALDLPVV